LRGMSTLPLLSRPRSIPSDLDRLASGYERCHGEFLSVDDVTPSVIGIPHYLMNAEHPRAVAALSAHLSHVLGVPAPTPAGHSEAVARWGALHDEVVDNDPQLKVYVQMLEKEYDRRAEAAIPSADDLGAQFEKFLDDQRDD